MKHDGVSMELTPRELGYLLFRKKICPKCGGRMTRSKTYETRYGYELESRREFFFADSARVKSYFYVFTCEDYETRYRLRDLADPE